MLSKSTKMTLIVFNTFILAFLLSLMPLPGKVQLIWPELIFLILVYWVLTAPFRVNVGIAWCIGFLVDLLTSSLIGLHALSFTCVAYFLTLIQHHYSFFNLWQRTLVIAIMLIINQLIILGVYALSGQSVWTLSNLYPLLTSILIWPILNQLLFRFKRRYQLG